jgi:hypothetical protein
MSGWGQEERADEKRPIYLLFCSSALKKHIHGVLQLQLCRQLVVSSHCVVGLPPRYTDADTRREESWHPVAPFIAEHSQQDPVVLPLPRLVTRLLPAGGRGEFEQEFETARRRKSSWIAARPCPPTSWQSRGSGRYAPLRDSLWIRFTVRLRLDTPNNSGRIRFIRTGLICTRRFVLSRFQCGTELPPLPFSPFGSPWSGDVAAR